MERVKQAIQKPHPQLLNALLKRAPNTDFSELLPMALRSSHECATLLLEHGADVNHYVCVVNTDVRSTLVHNACKVGHIQNATFLLDHGADLTLADAVGCKPIHSASARSDDQMLRLLLSRHADVNAPDDNNETPLHWAAACGNLSGVLLLLSNGADANALDSESQTPLHAACNCNRVEIVQVLIQHGAKMTLGAPKLPLFIALRKNHRYVVKVLLEAGSPTEFYWNSTLYTAFTPVQQFGSPYFVLLFQFDANIEQLTYEHFPALQLQRMSEMQLRHSRCFWTPALHSTFARTRKINQVLMTLMLSARKLGCPRLPPELWLHFLHLCCRSYFVRRDILVLG
eukprot:m.90524 g.90524  ORF g.90524 m.90524 type:complete len:342 (-) comp21591_c0_seq1:26-1051(-)